MNPNLAIYTSHDASIAVRCDDGQYRVAELERISNHRYYSLDNPPEGQAWLETFKQGLAAVSRWQPNFTPTFLAINPSEVVLNKRWSPVSHLTPHVACGHHDAHAACAFYQSPYDRATILSYDGGGPDADGQTQFFVIYTATRSTGIQRLAAYPINLGTAYLSHAMPVDEIQRSSRGGNWMSWAGKLMALAAYGEVDEGALDRLLNGACAEHVFNDTFKRRQLDWCATAQEYHLQQTLRHLLPHATDKATPLCVTGGCALNVKVNQRLRDLGYTVFVPPNPNDCGLALGCLLWQDRPQQQVTCTYNGLPWPGGEETYSTITLDEVADRLQRGQIIGYIEGDSELGPRALGHRSILCKGSLPHARARLNAIKGREWYRPVSPVIRRGQVANDSAFMSFAPFTHETHEWVHADGTTRLQTVNDESECHGLWELCHLVNEPLINTSLNLKGRPLVNNLPDAIEILRTTSLDCLVINNHLIEKP